MKEETTKKLLEATEEVDGVNEYMLCLCYDPENPERSIGFRAGSRTDIAALLAVNAEDDPVLCSAIIKAAEVIRRRTESEDEMVAIPVTSNPVRS